MIPPAEAFRRFGLGFLLGAGLGLLYGFLRPARQKHPHIADLFFVIAAFWAWLQLSFGICKGDIRLGSTSGLLLGALLWEWTFGRLLRPVFLWLWKIFGKIASYTLLPIKIFFKKLSNS